MDLERSENLDSSEVSENVGANSGGDGAGAGAGSGVDRSDLGPVGSGNGATSGGSPGSGGASGASGGNGLGFEGGSVEAPGGSSGDDSGNSGLGDRGKRGRGRPRKLDGGNRASGRNNSGAGSGGPGQKAPGLVDLGSNPDPKKVPDSVFEEKDLSKLSKGEIQEVAAKLLQAVFFAISQALGQEHWQLTNREAVELGAALWDCVKTLPAKQSKRIDKFLKEYAPWLKLAMVGTSILGARAATSLELMKLKKENEQLRNGNIGTAPVGGADPGTGFGFSPGATDEFIQ